MINKKNDISRARTLALAFRKNARNRKKEDGGFLLDEFDNLPQYGGGNYLPQHMQSLGLNTSMDTTSMSALQEMPLSSGVSPQGMIGSVASEATNFASDMVSPFFTPDTIQNGQVDINKGAAAAEGTLKGAQFGVAGALVGGIGGYFGAHKKEQRLQEELDEQQQLQTSNVNRQTRLSNLQPSPSYMPVAEKGGFISYDGQNHDGNKGGIPVDAQGNPTFITNSEPVALTEDKEVTWFDPEKGAYVFSDKLGFAEPAQKLVNKYKLDEKNINDPMLKEAVDKQFENLQTSQEMKRSKSKKGLNKGLPEKQLGGYADEYEGIPGIIPYEENAFNMDINVPYVPGNAPMAPRQGAGVVGSGQSSNYRSSLMNTPTSQMNAATYTNLAPSSSRFGRQYLGGGNDYGDWQQHVGQGAGYTAIDPATGKRANLNESSAALAASTDARPGRVHESILPAQIQGARGGEQIDYGMSTSTLKPVRDQAEYAETMSGAPGAEENYNPMLSPLAHGLSAVGSIADYYSMKKAKPQEVALPRVGAERVSYARQRLADRERANVASATASRTARNVGLGGGQAMTNIGAARLGINRQLGQEQTTSFEREQNQNALFRQQAGMTNAQIGMQEGLYNNRMQNAYQAQMAQMNPIGSLSRTAASYFKDNAAYQRGWGTLQMFSPNAEISQEPNTTWLDKWLGETRAVNFKGAPLQYTP